MEELRKGFNDDLDSIRKGVVELAALVTEALPRATYALLDHDLDVAEDVINGDDRLDLLSVEIEESCLSILALQSPVAKDMRALVTAMKLNDEFERSGDLVVNICKGIRRLYPLELSTELRGLITQMSDEALRLMRMAIDSYVESNSGLASALDDVDDRLDDLQQEYLSVIFANNPDAPKMTRQQAVQLAVVGRFYERIGDHAVNVGERVQYMVNGWLPEHAGATRERERRELEGMLNVPEDPAE